MANVGAYLVLALMLREGVSSTKALLSVRVRCAIVALKLIGIHILLWVFAHAKGELSVEYALLSRHGEKGCHVKAELVQDLLKFFFRVFVHSDGFVFRCHETSSSSVWDLNWLAGCKPACFGSQLL